MVSILYIFENIQISINSQGRIVDMAQQERNEMDINPNKCIYDASSQCRYPNKRKLSSTPKVYVISSTEFNKVVNWFKEVFDKHIRTKNDSKFDIVYFTDLPTWDFCNNVCIPILECWFCIAITKEELLPQHSRRKNTDFITGYVPRVNPNVFFEVGLALARTKGIIFYMGYNQDPPSDWTNMVKFIIKEPSLFLSSEDISVLNNKLKDIIIKNPFIGSPIKWIEDENE